MACGRACSWLIPLVLVAGAAAAQAEDDPPSSAGAPMSPAFERPGHGGGPTPVLVALYVLDISRFSDVDLSFTTDFVLRLQWQDPGLADADGPSVRTYQLGDVWNPAPLVTNQRRLFRRWSDFVEVDREGNVVYRQRFFGSMAARLHLRDFPFDRHTLKIEIVASRSPVGDIEFTISDQLSGRSPEFSLADAEILESRLDVGSYFFAPADVDLPMVSYEFDIRRHHEYYTWKVLLPLAVIVFMSWLVFYVDPSQLGPQIGLAATSVLTLIAYRFLLGGLVPRVSYLTRLDLFIMGATILVFLALVEAVMTVNLAAHDRGDAARCIDRWSRVGFPAAFVAVIVVAFVI